MPSVGDYKITVKKFRELICCFDSQKTGTFEGRFKNEQLDSLFFEKVHHVLNRGFSEVIRPVLHGQSIDTNDWIFKLGYTFEDFSRNELLSCLVCVYDGADEVLGTSA